MSNNIKVVHMDGVDAPTQTDAKPKRPKPLTADDLRFLYTAGWEHRVSKAKYGKNQGKACDLRVKIMAKAEEHILYRDYKENS